MTSPKISNVTSCKHGFILSHFIINLSVISYHLSVINLPKAKKERIYGYKQIKKKYEKNLNWIDNYQKVEKSIKELESKIERLKSVKQEIIEENTRKVINDYDSYDIYPEFYLDLRNFAKDDKPKIVLEKKSVFGKKSTYDYFKEKLEEYAGFKLTLVEVVTPIIETHFDRDLTEEEYTTVHHLLISDEKLTELKNNLMHMGEREYNKFLNNSGVFLLEDTSMYNIQEKAVNILNEDESYYWFYLSDFNNKQKHLLEEPIVKKYDKNLDDILLEVFDYCVKIERIKALLNEKENTQKRLKEQEELTKKSQKLQKEMEEIEKLIN